jgi:acetyltransferase-like isoleucine patch superfamily enzyme
VTEVHLDHDWFSAPLPANVEIGDGTWLYSSYAFLHYRSVRPCGVRIGRECGIYIDTMFDLGPSGEVVIGDHTTLSGPIFSTNGRVVVGDHVLMSSQVVVADRAAAVPVHEHGDAGEPDLAVVVGDLAWIGTRAVLLAGARIGPGAIVGANTVVDFEVPPYAIVGGDPARVIGRAEPRQPSEPATP